MDITIPENDLPKHERSRAMTVGEIERMRRLIDSLAARVRELDADLLALRGRVSAARRLASRHTQLDIHATASMSSLLQEADCLGDSTAAQVRRMDSELMVRNEQRIAELESEASRYMPCL
jgi:chromosome segregation ATPase